MVAENQLAIRRGKSAPERTDIEMKRILAFDFGASSGRAMLGQFADGKITAEEIHRFSNDPVPVNGVLYWDLLRLYHEIRTAITKAVNRGGFDAIGIDTWGVDFGLLDKKGNLLGNPVHYRDPRTADIPDEVFQIVPKKEIYRHTGIQFMHFNTIYQLYYLATREPELLERTDMLLQIPDLFAYFLTGVKKGERTNASTTNLYNPYTRDWDRELCRALGIPERILPPLIDAGEQYGTLRPELCRELGCDPVPVIAVGTHDTASAVVSAPAAEKDFVYISCGTWSLFGTENDVPVINEASVSANFTNEGGYGGTVRFLKNIMGLWLIQESRRQWIREGQEVTFNQLEQEALASAPFASFIDVDHPYFESPGDLPGNVVRYCRETGQKVPATRGEIMRCIYESLAMKYRYTFRSLQTLTGKSYRHIHVLGGGIKDGLLCRMTAAACNATVLAGPAEATVTGNIAVQLISMGELADLREARKVIRDSTPLQTYQPESPADWDAHYEAFLRAIGRSDPASDNIK
jgi:rhamnulokinase